MNSTKKTTDYVTSLLLLTFLVVSITNLPVLAQESQGSIIPGPWGKKVFLFLHTAAKALGEFLIFVISKIMGEKLSDLVIPLGYMTLLSLIIVVFQFEERARRRIWQIIMLRWGFLVFRVVMEALKINPT